MSNLPANVRKTPKWVWFSVIPVFGGLALVYAGSKANFKSWIWLGLGFTISSWIFSGNQIGFLIWIAQIVTSFSLKNKYQLKVNADNLEISDRRIAQLVAEHRGRKIDINTASKDDLVYGLDLPIVYANQIEEIRKEGFIFTSLEELVEVAGIPEKIVHDREPLITFSYDIKQDYGVSWRRLNTYSEEQLIAAGIEPKAARLIVLERQKNGPYNSVIDVKKRTGLPLSYYQHLI
ncbi:MAG: helix-hairpin-helix domain-containing protein [Geminocystis sp.]|nr:helix-hairpin-helix domain-containing protein [Geminocystis sp.]HIK36900.1 helix-hairpin-helix domain-containing protein [Geminocystis sp. M7585_C2015_104]MCS7148544.1 helix-hairpin-helix domain-containing protein [Geminocystis sp.]MCX8079500.1 helix-hairpin-helix domain-containing protein [Geminocystis sp.]MDW8114883.1 helix-hairpin-helix domain-containing protein [Geminocystis sp.]